MSGKPLLVTCGLPYTNGPCHIGHLRTYVPADFYVRYMRRAGEDVVFICGSDNHGTPIVISAEQEGSTPRELSERYHQHFDSTFKRMLVEFDRFGMTDDPTNHETTKDLVQRLIDRGYVYPKTISQSYCPDCSRFLPDRYVEGICPHCGAVARGDECDQGCGQHLEPGEIKDALCKVCGGKAEYRDQEHYFFKLSEFKDFLLEYLPDLRGTSNARNYALGWVKESLHDWCITRTLEWGVKFPGRDDLVVYVWVDAPIGYISFTKEWADSCRCGLAGVLVRRRYPGHALHRRRHHLPPLHLLACTPQGRRRRSAARRGGERDGHDRREEVLEVTRLRRLDERRLPGAGSPRRLPPLLSPCLYEPHQGARLLLAGLPAAGEQRARRDARQLHLPHHALRREGVRRRAGRSGRACHPRGDRSGVRHRRPGDAGLRIQERRRCDDDAGIFRERLHPEQCALETDRAGPGCGGAGDR